ncbi:N-acetyl-D-glucosamine kinase isoform X2 [Hydra vulgaris]
MGEYFFAGCEGGASHSVMIIVNQHGSIVAETEGEGTNHWLIGMEECVRRIYDMLCKCKLAAGIPESFPLISLGLSLSGADDIIKQTEISDLFLKTYPNCTKYCFTCNDTLSPLLTAVKGGGVVIIAGTGSNCLFYNNGKIINCGGWGHLLGDKGGAHWIVLKSLRTIYEDMDGFKRSLHSTDYLKQAMFDYFKMNDKYCILPHLYPMDGKTIDKKMIAKFCVEGILKGAVDGDLLCLHLFKLAGIQLGKHIKALIPKIDLEMLHTEGGLKVLCIGSVWKSWDYLKEGFLTGLRPLTDEEKQLKEITLVKLKPEAKASHGACLWAANKAGFNFPMDYGKMSFAFFNYKFF